MLKIFFFNSCVPPPPPWYSVIFNNFLLGFWCVRVFWRQMPVYTLLRSVEFSIFLETDPLFLHNLGPQFVQYLPPFGIFWAFWAAPKFSAKVVSNLLIKITALTWNRWSLVFLTVVWSISRWYFETMNFNNIHIRFYVWLTFIQISLTAIF